MSLGNAANIIRPAATIPVTQHTGNVAAAPYIDISPEKIMGYLNKIANLKEHAHSPFKSETRRPLPKEDSSPQIAAQTAKPKVLKLHPDPVQAEEFTPSFEQAGSNLAVLATLAKGIGNKELVSAINNFRQEQRALRGAIA